MSYASFLLGCVCIFIYIFGPFYPFDAQRPTRVLRQSAETRWLQTSEVNLRGLVDGAKQAWKKMEQACNRQAKSINISSTSLTLGSLSPS